MTKNVLQTPDQNVLETPDQKALNRAKLLEIVRKIYGSNIDHSKRAKFRDQAADLVVTDDNIKEQLRKGKLQLDTGDFLIFFLDMLVLEKQLINLKTNHFYNDASLKECVSAKNDKATSIECQIGKDDINASGCIKAFQAEELIEGDNTIRNEGGQWTKKKIDLEIPENSEFVVSLKRFENSYTNNRFTQKKIDKDIKLDPVIIDSQKYEPTAFIVHLGSGPAGGHYVSYIKEKNGESKTDYHWVCYNDSARTELGVNLPEQAKKAYFIKYSPIADESKTGAEKYKTGLPPSQKCGTHNGGNRCWANAAFAFGLSMNCAYREIEQTASQATETDDKVENAEKDADREKATIRPFSSNKIEKLVSVLLDLEEKMKLEEIVESMSKFNQALKEVQKEETTAQKQVEERLKEMGYSDGIKTIIGNAVGRILNHLVSKISNDSIDEIFDLQENLSSLDNLEKIIEIFDQKNLDNFLKEPRNFCESKGLCLNQEKTKSKSFIDLAYESFLEDKKDEFKQYFDLAQKKDRNSLTIIMNRLVLGQNADPGCTQKDIHFVKLEEYCSKDNLTFKLALNQKLGEFSAVDLFNQKQTANETQLIIKKDYFYEIIDSNFFKENSVKSDSNLTEKTLIKIAPKQDKIGCKNNQFWSISTNKDLLNKKFENNDDYNFSETFSSLISDAIKESINSNISSDKNSSSLTNQQAAIIILLAIKHRGIGSLKNKESLNLDIKQLVEKQVLNLGGLSQADFLEKAKIFSARFQNKMVSKEIYTGNPYAQNLVGMRLKRLDPEFALNLLGNDTKKYNEIQGFLGVDFEKIMLQETPSPSPKPLKEKSNSVGYSNSLNLP